MHTQNKTIAGPAQAPSVLTFALVLIGMGIPIVPLHAALPGGRCGCGRADCEKPGKHPVFKWVTGGGYNHPSLNPDRVREWFGRGVDRDGIPLSSRGVAGLTGEASRILVLDVDNKPAEGKDGLATLATLEAQHGALPRVPRVITGSGGEHRYFAWPEGGCGSPTGIAPGIDIRCDGALITLPPTLHTSGRRYEMDPAARFSDFLEGEAVRRLRLPEVPAWLLTMARRGWAPKGNTESKALSSKYVVSRADAAAALAVVLDAPYTQWVVSSSPAEVSREAWHVLGTNLIAACSGHKDLLEVAREAWIAAIREVFPVYRPDKAEFHWKACLDRKVLSFELVSNEVPDWVSSSGFKNLVLEARAEVRYHPRTEAFVDAALAYLVEQPGQLATNASERGVTPRGLLLDEGYLE